MIYPSERKKSYIPGRKEDTYNLVYREFVEMHLNTDGKILLCKQSGIRKPWFTKPNQQCLKLFTENFTFSWFSMFML